MKLQNGWVEKMVGHRAGLLIFFPVGIFYRLNKINILGEPRAISHFRHFSSEPIPKSYLFI